MIDEGGNSAVARHYGKAGLTGRILAALAAHRDDPRAALTAADLHAVDQLHHGGLGLTRQLADLAGIAPGMRVLDAGSGIGGPARYLAGQRDCLVDAIDLTPEFVETARALDRLVGLGDRIAQRVASVTALPFPDGRFDVVWSQNVTMNVGDKPAMFAEAFRVLRPGGVFAFSHLGRGSGGEIDYPLPWAASAAASFPTPPDDILALLAAAGFGPVNVLPAPAPVPAARPGGPDSSVVMGADMARRGRNAAAALADGRLIAMTVAARRP